VKEHENHDLLFADFVDQPVMPNEKFPHGRIADLRNSPSPFREISAASGRRIWLNPSGPLRIDANLVQ